MARDVVDELLTGYPTVFYFIVSVFCFHLAALVRASSVIAVD